MNEKILKKVIELLQQELEDNSIEVTADSDIMDDLGMSSMEVTTLMATLEEEFDVEIPNSKIREMIYVRNIAEIVYALKKREKWIDFCTMMIERLDKNKRNTFNEYIQDTPEMYGDMVACQYIEEGQIVKVNYKQFTQDINRVSRYLLACNMQGKHIGLLGRNSYRWIVCYFAIVNINSVAVLLNSEASSEELFELIQKTEVDALIAESEWQEDFQVMYLFTMEQIWGKMSIFSGEKLICEGSPEALSTICFTSGTTGKQMGVMLSQKCLLSACTMKICAGIDFQEIRSMLLIPLYHIKGLAGMIITLTGTSICINRNLKYFYQELKIFSPHYIDVVPMMLNIICKELRKKNFNRDILGKNLKTIYCGGAKMDNQIAEEFKKAGIQVVQAYGMTEIAGGIAINTSDSEKLNSAGKVFPWVQIKIVEGEIVVKSQYTMLGYYKDEMKTSESLKDGWLYTGDFGYVDKEGFLYITGRKKNLIILSNGKNISPEELEEKLSGCSLIREVMVYEENDKICAEIYGEPDENIQKEIREFILRQNLKEPLYKQIRTVKFRSAEFEKTESGKIKRK